MVARWLPVVLLVLSLRQMSSALPRRQDMDGDREFWRRERLRHEIKERLSSCLTLDCIWHSVCDGLGYGWGIRLNDECPNYVQCQEECRKEHTRYMEHFGFLEDGQEGAEEGSGDSGDEKDDSGGGRGGSNGGSSSGSSSNGGNSGGSNGGSRGGRNGGSGINFGLGGLGSSFGSSSTGLGGSSSNYGLGSLLG